MFCHHRHKELKYFGSRREKDLCFPYEQQILKYLPSCFPYSAVQTLFSCSWMSFIPSLEEGEKKGVQEKKMEEMRDKRKTLTLERLVVRPRKVPMKVSWEERGRETNNNFGCKRLPSEQTVLLSRLKCFCVSSLLSSQLLVHEQAREINREAVALFGQQGLTCLPSSPLISYSKPEERSQQRKKDEMKKGNLRNWSPLLWLFLFDSFFSPPSLLFPLFSSIASLYESCCHEREQCFSPNQAITYQSNKQSRMRVREDIEGREHNINRYIKCWRRKEERGRKDGAKTENKPTAEKNLRWKANYSLTWKMNVQRK